MTWGKPGSVWVKKWSVTLLVLQGAVGLMAGPYTYDIKEN